jgi:hypothetical protein
MLEASRSILGKTAVSPWYFPSVGEYATLLERIGLEVTYAALFERLTALDGETGMRNWVQMFGRSILEQIPPDSRDDFVGQVEDRTRSTLYRDGNWFADYRRLRVVAQ